MTTITNEMSVDHIILSWITKRENKREKTPLMFDVLLDYRQIMRLFHFDMCMS